MTKAKLTIEPGCEAGSKLCGECEFLASHSYDFDGHCDCFDFEFKFAENPYMGALSKRCKACLDAEVTE